MVDSIQHHRVKHLQDQTDEHRYQFELVCDSCQKVYRSDSVTLEDAQTGEDEPDWWEDPVKKESMMAFIQQVFRLCNKCHQWVCRDNCWEAIRCMCDRCANPATGKTMTTQTPESHDSVYSSILGGICTHCDMVLPTHAKSCPECGHPV